MANRFVRREKDGEWVVEIRGDLAEELEVGEELDEVPVTKRNGTVVYKDVVVYWKGHWENRGREGVICRAEIRE